MGNKKDMVEIIYIIKFNSVVKIYSKNYIICQRINDEIMANCLSIYMDLEVEIKS